MFRPSCLPKTTGLLLFSLLTVSAHTWQETGHLAGRITDQEGATLDNVEITVEGKYLFKPRTVFTDASGRFRVTNMPPAEDYRVAVIKPGFRTLVRQDVTVQLGETTKMDAVLQIKSIDEAIAESDREESENDSDAG